MPTGADTVARRFADAYLRKGTRFTLRRVSEAFLGSHPPTLVDPVLDGNHQAGDTTVAIRATHASGRILAGDKIKIGELSAVPVGANASARQPSVDPTVAYAPGFDAITLVTPLLSDVDDGATVTMTWSTDVTLYGAVLNRPRSLGQDQSVNESISIILPAFGISPAPKAQDLIGFGSAFYRIITVSPRLERDTLVAWVVEAR